MVVGLLVVFGTYAGLSSITWDTTVPAHFVDRVPHCRRNLTAGGHLLGGPLVPFPGDERLDDLPPGDLVRVHHQLLHPNRYFFLASDGHQIRLHVGGATPCGISG
jgi:hypothetical protein